MQAFLPFQEPFFQDLDSKSWDESVASPKFFLSKLRRSIVWQLAFVCALIPAIATAQQGGSGSVEFNLQGKIKLDTLLSYISQRLGTKFEYTTQVGDRSVVLRAPGNVPIQSLPALLGSVLRTESLALIDSDVAGWKRVVDVGEMKRYAPTGKALDVLEQNGAASPVTQVFVLRNASAASLSTVLKPLLTENGSNLISLSDSNVLIVTDYAAVVTSVAKLIEALDQAEGVADYQTYTVQHQPVKVLAEQVRGVLGTGRSTTSSRVTLLEQSESNRILVAGTQLLVQQALDLLRQLDVSIGLTTKVYRFKHSTAERIDKLARGLIRDSDVDRIYHSTIDEDGNLLLVRATNEIHEQLRQLVDEIDIAVDSSDSPIQFYKLKNANAIDVLYSLLALQEAYGGNSLFGGAVPAGFNTPFGGYGVPVGNAGFPGGASLGYGANQPNLELTPLPAAPQGANESFLPDVQNPLARPTMADGTGRLPVNGGLAGGGFTGGGVATLPGGARVSADISTNSLIVVAPANIQEMYAKLIQSLDQRRPQVLIEAKIVAVDTSNDFSLGVEVSAGDRSGATRVFEFTSFGLSQVNPQTGQLQIIPGLGFNGTVVDPNVADVVVRALSAHSRARVLAAPKILVNDNSTGKLESVNSIPFTSVNASQTVSTTSLGGNQQAGTIITVTPHINEDNHLQLAFDVEFSTFSGAAANGLPPPRQIDRVGSSVTIPDGKTVVVGGLKRVSDSESFTGLPWAEKIPIVRELTSRTDRSQQTTSFFLFIRPIVLRDSRFADLSFLSDKEASQAQVPGDYPKSFPEMIP